MSESLWKGGEGHGLTVELEHPFDLHALLLVLGCYILGSKKATFLGGVPVELDHDSGRWNELRLGQRSEHLQDCDRS